MALTDGLIVIGVFAGFGLLIWGRLNKRNSPILIKIKEFMQKPKEKLEELEGKDAWYPPSIERKIN